jgi:hypothetical protein
MKYKNLLGSHSDVASCTNQQLLQILAVSKIRATKHRTIVRSIRTDFTRVRLAVGIKDGVSEDDKDPVISYYISTISTDPIFLLVGLVLMQSKRLEDFLLKIAKNAEEIFDYDDEAQEHPSIIDLSFCA